LKQTAKTATEGTVRWNDAGDNVAIVEMARAAYNIRLHRTEITPIPIDFVSINHPCKNYSLYLCWYRCPCVKFDLYHLELYEMLT